MENQTRKAKGEKTAETKAWQLPVSTLLKDIETRIPGLKGKVTEESIRERYSHAYNPRRNEGFFANKIILVEGLTEEYSLPIYADAIPGCSFDPQGISVVECEGKGSMDRLYRIFNELHIPCYILFDYDSGNSDRDIIKKSHSLLALVGMSQEPPQSLLVGDSIACFQKTWESDLRTEIPDMDTLTSEARKLLGLKNDSGKPLIARFIATKITTRTPPVVPQSLERIIRKAVAVAWTGSCLKS